MLKISSLTMRFGGVTAVDNVSLAADSARITAIIGPNGAGKTTLFNCITGFYKPTEGRITLHKADKSQEIAGRKSHQIARLGIARTFQNIRLFSNMTVLENLLVAQHAALSRASLAGFGAILGLPSYQRAERVAVDVARGWLDRLMLLKAADRMAGELPYGMQRRVEIARAMCMAPQILCLDEPAAGLNPSESVRLREAIARIREEQKITILLVEHNMNVVMEISDHVVVLDYGKKIAEGSPNEVRRNPTVIKAYLGEEDVA